MPAIDLDRLAGSAGDCVREERRRSVREATEMIVRELTLHHESGRVSQPPNPLMVELILTGIEGLSFRYHAAGRGAELIELHPAIRALMVRSLL